MNERRIVYYFLTIMNDSVKFHFLSALKDTSCSLLRLESSLLLWWESHRPIGWTYEQHLKNPAVNCTGSPFDEKLALEVGRLLAARSPREEDQDRSSPTVTGVLTYPNSVYADGSPTHVAIGPSTSVKREHPKALADNYQVIHRDEATGKVMVYMNEEWKVRTCPHTGKEQCRMWCGRESCVV